MEGLWGGEGGKRVGWRWGFGREVGGAQGMPAAASLGIALAPCCSELGRERMLLPKEWVEVLSRRFSREHPGRQIEIRLMGARGDQAALDQLSDVIRMPFPASVTPTYAAKTSLPESLPELSELNQL